MKKFFLTLAILVMAICASAQKNQYFWYQGNLMLGNPIAQIDSVTFDEEDTDSILIYLPRTIIKTVHDTVYITIHDTVCPNAIPEGALAGEFSVSPTKKVRFSKGNLQFHMKDSVWRFADNQYEVMGDANGNCGEPAYDGYIDLFGWSTNSTYFGVSSSTYNLTYTGSFVDWGQNISLEWFTMSIDEWDYLLHSRQNASQLVATGRVNGQNGLILLPDNWISISGIYFNSGYANLYGEYYFLTVNDISNQDWLLMEENGAVFLPAAGHREGTNVLSIQRRGLYWSSTSESNGVYDYLNINSDQLSLGPSEGWEGFSVRLVQEVK